LGLILHRLGQPTVIGEIIGGIVLGPSLLGRIAPDLFAQLFPSTSAPFLNVIAQLGVILYMYLIGLEIDVPTIRRSGGVMLAIAHASIAAPFVLGSLLALLLYPVVSTSGVPFTAFALFVGVSVSVTAFPVLARILSDQGVSKSPMGSLVLGCAAIADVAAWCLLALTVSTIQEKPADAVATLALTGVFVGAMVLVVRPLLHHLVCELEARERLTDGGIAIVAVAVLLAAFTTEVIGIHAIFGAFLLGAITPRGRVADELNDRTEAIVRVMLLPAFFAYTGLRTQIGLLSGGEDWLMCGLIVAVATVGKWGGSTIAARVVGIGWRNASAVGALMNTRGLVELIVLNIGLDLKIISPTLFTMLVIMALVTTITAPPIFQLITRTAPWASSQT
jgi:Kef-type K+ transport system membrane component KefB